MPVSALKTYGRRKVKNYESRCHDATSIPELPASPASSAVDALFAKNREKRLFLAKNEKSHGTRGRKKQTIKIPSPPRPSPFLNDESIHLRGDTTFDKLCQGPIYNSVQLCNVSAICINSSTEHSKTDNSSVSFKKTRKKYKKTALKSSQKEHTKQKKDESVHKRGKINKKKDKDRKLAEKIKTLKNNATEKNASIVSTRHLAESLLDSSVVNRSEITKKKSVQMNNSAEESINHSIIIEKVVKRRDPISLELSKVLMEENELSRKRLLNGSFASARKFTPLASTSRLTPNISINETDYDQMFQKGYEHRMRAESTPKYSTPIEARKLQKTDDKIDISPISTRNKSISNNNSRQISQLLSKNHYETLNSFKENISGQPGTSIKIKNVTNEIIILDSVVSNCGSKLLKSLENSEQSTNQSLAIGEVSARPYSRKFKTMSETELSLECGSNARKDPKLKAKTQVVLAKHLEILGINTGQNLVDCSFISSKENKNTANNNCTNSIKKNSAFNQPVCIIEKVSDLKNCMQYVNKHSYKSKRSQENSRLSDLDTFKRDLFTTKKTSSHDQSKVQFNKIDISDTEEILQTSVYTSSLKVTRKSVLSDVYKSTDLFSSMESNSSQNSTSRMKTRSLTALEKSQSETDSFRKPPSYITSKSGTNSLQKSHRMKTRSLSVFETSKTKTDTDNNSKPINNATKRSRSNSLHRSSHRITMSVSIINTSQVETENTSATYNTKRNRSNSSLKSSNRKKTKSSSGLEDSLKIDNLTKSLITTRSKSKSLPKSSNPSTYRMKTRSLSALENSLSDSSDNDSFKKSVNYTITRNRSYSLHTPNKQMKSSSLTTVMQTETDLEVFKKPDNVTIGSRNRAKKPNHCMQTRSNSSPKKTQTDDTNPVNNNTIEKQRKSPKKSIHQKTRNANTSNDIIDSSLTENFDTMMPLNYITTRKRKVNYNNPPTVNSANIESAVSLDEWEQFSQSNMTLIHVNNAIGEEISISSNTSRYSKISNVQTKCNEGASTSTSCIISNIEIVSEKHNSSKQTEDVENEDLIAIADKQENIVLKPGKQWFRSLSILRSTNVGAVDLSETTNKGRKWRESICQLLDKQDKNSSVLNASPNHHEISAINESEQRQSGHLKLRTALRRTSIKVVPLPSVRCSYTVFESSSTNKKSGYVSTVANESILESFDKLSLTTDAHDREQTAREIILKRCGQTAPIPFEKCYTQRILKKCRKIGEGVYGEVFMYKTSDNRCIVMKVIPIEGSQVVNGEHQKKFEEIISEIIIASELSNLRANKEFSTAGFAELLKIRCVQGKYPQSLVDLWELYDEDHGSENDSPVIFTEDQLYIVLELANAGQDLEAYHFHNAEQAYALFVQIVCALAVAESALEFEHRDMHWGNILISPTDDVTATFRLKGREFEVATRGLKMSIIDFTLSRMTYDNCCIFNDLSMDPELFTATGDYQFEIYRLMQQKNKNDWQHFEPFTNILWLDYILEKMTGHLRYVRPNTRTHKTSIRKLSQLRKKILSFSSATDLLNSDVFSHVFL